MLNFPKTGSSFARAIIRKAYNRRLSAPLRLLSAVGLSSGLVRELASPKIDEQASQGLVDQHGTYRQIPAEYRDRLVTTISRNPFSRYLSAYRFRWWATHPPAPLPSIRKRYPRFPDLTFEEYYDMAHRFGVPDRLAGARINVSLGLHSLQFIQFYCAQPAKVLAKLSEAYLDSGEIRDDLAPNIRFLRQENLNSDIAELLRDVGFRPSELAFIGSADRINVTEPSDKSKSDCMSPSVAAEILRRDRLLFDLFPDYRPAT